MLTRYSIALVLIFALAVLAQSQVSYTITWDISTFGPLFPLDRSDTTPNTYTLDCFGTVQLTLCNDNAGSALHPFSVAFDQDVDATTPVNLDIASNLVLDCSTFGGINLSPMLITDTTCFVVSSDTGMPTTFILFFPNNPTDIRTLSIGSGTETYTWAFNFVQLDGTADFAYNLQVLSQVQGDPHFVGFLGQKYDFHGEPGLIFNLVSDNNFQLNSFFVDADLRRLKNKTYMGQLGFRIGNDKVFFSCNRQDGTTTSLLNGEPIESRGKVWLAHGTVQRLSSGSTIIESMQYRFRVKFSRSSHSTCHINFKTKYLKVANLPIPHGILGQTADESREFPLVSSDFQGKGVVSGHWTEYIVDGDIFSTNYLHNKFNTTGFDRYYNKYFAGAEYLTAEGE